GWAAVRAPAPDAGRADPVPFGAGRDGREDQPGDPGSERGAALSGPGVWCARAAWIAGARARCIVAYRHAQTPTIRSARVRELGAGSGAGPGVRRASGAG